ncbi:ERF family protein [Vreelandella venusta]|uniref:ERF family protein n=1 Tax=Vreelandella venusta TaxID=44935 RepID=UPI004043F4B5
MSNAVATTQEASPPVEAPRNEATAIIQVIERAAMNPDVDIDKMERLLQMQERVMDRQATMDFNAAMAAMQDEMPSIAERGKSHNGNYATFEDINDVAKPIMKRHGFAVSFRVHNIPGGIEVTGVLMHKGGHREETTMTLPLDDSGKKSSVQQVGSSVSYGKRYVMSAMLNITTRGEDDDGNSAAPVKTVSIAQAAYLKSLLSKCPQVTCDWFAGEFGEPELVPASKYDKLSARLKSGIEKQEAANADHQGA